MNLMANPVLMAANLDPSKGLTPHYRVRTPDAAYDGKYLVFGTGNIIIAGTKNHSAGMVAAMRMTRVLARHTPKSQLLWASAHSAPNTVVTARLNYTVGASVKKDSKSNYTDKFPGIALQVSCNSITPELYLRKSMVIIPGITRAADCVQALDEIIDITKQHRLAPAAAAQ